MSKYTTEVRYICEKYAGQDESKGFNDIESIIEASRGQIFNNYPIFDETYRAVLEKKILMHYYTREICCETVGLWKLRLASRMNEIMPKYNKLYLSDLLEYNPLYDVDLTTTHSKDGNTVGSNVGNLERAENSEKNGVGNSAKSNTEKNENTMSDKNENTYIENTNGKRQLISDIDQDHWQKYSDTPQGYINNIANDTYLTNATHDTADDNTTDNERTNYSKGSTTFDERSSENSVERTVSETGNIVNNEVGNNDIKEKRNESNIINSSEDYAEHVIGKRGGASYAKMINEYRDTLLNIDLMIINELKDLFFMLW